MLRDDLAKVEKKAEKNEQGLEVKLSRLEETLEKASTLLAQNNANMGAEVSDLTTDQFKLNGLVMDAKRTTVELKTAAQTNASRLQELENRIAALESPQANHKTADAKEEKLAEAKKHFENNKLGESEAIISTLLKTSPNQAIAGEALFLMGRIYTKQKKWGKALAEFQSVYEKHASHPLADDALWNAGQTAEKIRWCSDARAYYSLLRQNYPTSKFSKKARAAGLRLKKNSTNSQICRRS